MWRARRHFFPTRISQAFRELSNALAFAQLCRDLTRGKYRMHEEQRKDTNDGRLGDEVILEHCRHPVESPFAGQDRADQHNVSPHEQRQYQTGTAADYLVCELASGNHHLGRLVHYGFSADMMSGLSSFSASNMWQFSQSFEICFLSAVRILRR